MKKNKCLKNMDNCIRIHFPSLIWFAFTATEINIFDRNPICLAIYRYLIIAFVNCLLCAAFSILLSMAYFSSFCTTHSL